MTDDSVLHCDLTQDLFNQATQYGMAKWSQRFVAAIWNLLRAYNFESPLEAGFFIWWHVYTESRGLEDVLSLQQQSEVRAGNSSYRLDFSVFPMDWPELSELAKKHDVVPFSVGVELDGHEFHERTKEQVARRDKRDRDLLSAGWRVLHYSGSEFVKDPEAVIQEVCSVAEKAAVELRMQLMKLDGRTTGGNQR